MQANSIKPLIPNFSLTASIFNVYSPGSNEVIDQYKEVGLVIIVLSSSPFIYILTVKSSSFAIDILYGMLIGIPDSYSASLSNSTETTTLFSSTTIKLKLFDVVL